MKRVLITGMSGTGKSSVIRALAARGFKAVDADYGWSEEGPRGDWLWREDRMRDLLATEDADVLFVAGCATNQGRFRPWFDHVVLLSAPGDLLFERLASRATNTFGKRPEELARVREDLAIVEPVLRRAATHVVDTTASLDEVVARILQAAGEG